MVRKGMKIAQKCDIWQKILCLRCQKMVYETLILLPNAFLLTNIAKNITISKLKLLKETEKCYYTWFFKVFGRFQIFHILNLNIY